MDDQMTGKARVVNIASRLAVTLAIAVWMVPGMGCDKETGESERHSEAQVGEHLGRTGSGDVKQERQLASAEVDTLRVWKARVGLTRDEYWDGYGGVVANEWAEVWYPPGNLTITHAMFAFIRLAEARERVAIVFGALPTQRLKIVCSVSMDSYVEQAGRQWWQYSRIQEDEITFQPIPVLFQRGLGHIATVHEYSLWAAGRLSDSRAPLWVRHGLATLLSGESGVLKDQLVEFPNDPVVRTLAEVEEALQKNTNKKDVRLAAFNAWHAVKAITDRHGLLELGAVVRSLGEGESLDQASRTHLGASWDDVTTEALAWQEGWSR